MPTHIQFHRSNIHGATPDVKYLLEGEPAVNLYDKKLWVKGVSGDLITFIDGTTGERVAGSNTEIQYKAESGFSASGKLVFDGFGLSADGATFGSDIIINSIRVGRGSGDSSLNTVVGLDALKDNTTGIQTVAIGRHALEDNTTGISNTGVGYKALTMITTGDTNTAVGQGTLQKSQTGDNNTAVGQRALDANTDGSDNTALGKMSLFKNTRGVKNTSVGTESLYSSEHEPVTGQTRPRIFGDCNTAVGFQSGYQGVTGDYNTGVGFKSLYNTDGNSNTAIGASAGYGILKGSKNTALGASAGQLQNRIDGHNNTFLGHASEPSSITVSDEITFGDTNVNKLRTGNDGFVVSTKDGISAEGATFGQLVHAGASVRLPTGQSIVDGSQNPVFKVLDDRRIQIGDGDNSGNGTNMLIRDSTQSIDLDAPNIFVKEDIKYVGGFQNTKINFMNQEMNFHITGTTFASGYINQFHLPLGLSADMGATFGGNVLISGGAGDVTLTLEADTDNDGENDNPMIHMVQDGGAVSLDIGLAGLVSQALYTDATNNAAYLNSPDEWSDIQFATNDKARMTIHRTTGKVGIHTSTPRESLEVRGNVMSNAGISGATFSVGSNIAFSDGTTFGSTQTEIIGVAVDNGTQVLTTGKKGHRMLPYDCEVTEWRINSRDSGGVTWDVNWCDWDAYPTTASVGGSGLPIINSNTAAGYSGSDTSINWTKKSFNAGDILEFEVDTVDVMTNCTLSLKIRRNG